MKKVVVSIIILAIIFLNFVPVLAVETKNTMSENATSQLIDEKNKRDETIEGYVKQYGSESYGMTAYVLNRVRIYSIPLCFVGIAVGALYQYVLGTRRLDMKQKGFGLIIAFVTILVICQVLPLVFAIVTKGWN